MTHRSAALMLGFMLVGSSAALVPTALTVVEYPLPRPKAFPHDPAVGRDGIVWYTDQANSYIGRLDPETGKVTDYPTPTAVSGPHGIIVAPDGAVWYTANFKGRLGRLDPTTGTIKEYALPAEAPDPHTPLYHDGKIWFTVQGSNVYGWLDPKSDEAKLFPVATPDARPYGIVAGPPPDGSIWMALFGTNQTGRADPLDLFRPEQRHPDRAVGRGAGDDAVRPRVRRRDRKELRLARLRIEPAVHVRALDGEPDLAVVIQRRVRVARLGGQRVLLDRAGRRVEPAEPAFEVGGVPHGTIGRDDDPMRARHGGRRGVVRHLAGFGVEPPDVAIRLVRVPHDPVAADGRVVRERLGPGQWVLDHGQGRGHEGGAAADQHEAEHQPG